jgi:uncharacterized protein YbjT (DUF2867 family)
VKVILFGATGMVGAGVLHECLRDDRVSEVLAVVRSSSPRTHPKLREMVRSDFLDYSDAHDDFRGAAACFFCLGVTAVGKTEEEYHRLTFDITLAAARTMAELNPGMTFCYVSGQGTDSSERGRSMWARVKGKTENALLQLPLEAYMLRPGYIQPLGGIKSKTRVYRIFYEVMTPFYPVLRRLTPNLVTTNEMVGRAMISVAVRGYPARVLEVRDINKAGKGGEG